MEMNVNIFFFVNGKLLLTGKPEKWGNLSKFRKSTWEAVNEVLETETAPFLIK